MSKDRRQPTEAAVREIRRRTRHRALDDAIRTAASTRLRAVSVTTLTTMVGLLPLALNGGDLWTPFAVSMTFGLIFATALTLLGLPAAYRLLEKLNPTAPPERPLRQ